MKFFIDLFDLSKIRKKEKNRIEIYVYYNYEIDIEDFKTLIIKEIKNKYEKENPNIIKNMK